MGKYFIPNALLKVLSFFFSVINEIDSFSLSVFYSTKCRDYLYVCMNVCMYVGILFWVNGRLNVTEIQIPF